MPSHSGPLHNPVSGSLSRSANAHHRVPPVGTVVRFSVGGAGAGSRAEGAKGTVELHGPSFTVAVEASRLPADARTVTARIISKRPLQLSLLSVERNGSSPGSAASDAFGASDISSGDARLAATELALSPDRVEQIAQHIAPRAPELGRLLAEVLMATGRNLPVGAAEVAFVQRVLRLFRRSTLREPFVRMWLALECAERGLAAIPTRSAHQPAGARRLPEKASDEPLGEETETDHSVSLSDYLHREAAEPTSLLQWFNHRRSEDAELHWIVIPIGADAGATAGVAAAASAGGADAAAASAGATAGAPADPPAKDGSAQRAVGELFLGIPVEEGTVSRIATIAILNVVSDRLDWWFRWDRTRGAMHLTGTLCASESIPLDSELLVRLTRSVHTGPRESSPMGLVHSVADLFGRGVLDGRR